jgi:hypothetical protein
MEVRTPSTFRAGCENDCRNLRCSILLSVIAIPSEPPGNHYEECASILRVELVRLAFDGVRREGACVLAAVGTGC